MHAACGLEVRQQEILFEQPDAHLLLVHTPPVAQAATFHTVTQWHYTEPAGDGSKGNNSIDDADA